MSNKTIQFVCPRKPPINLTREMKEHAEYLVLGKINQLSQLNSINKKHALDDQVARQLVNDMKREGISLLTEADVRAIAREFCEWNDTFWPLDTSWY